MNKKVGLPPEIVEKMNNTLSAGTVGKFYPGTQLDAAINGACAGFTSSMLLPYVDAAAGTKVPALLMTASAGSGVGTLEEYMILGEQGYWRVAASSVTAAGVPATAGLYNTISTLPKVRGVFKCQLGDKDDDSTIIIDNDANTFLPVGSSQDWEVEFGVAAMTNISQAATVGFIELGVAGGAVDDDSSAAPSTYYAEFKIAASTITAKTETTASVKALALPSGYNVFKLVYVASQKKIYFYLNEDLLGGAAVHDSMTAAQCFVRVAHLTAYTAATDAPISADVDYIIAHAPLLDNHV